MGSMGLPPKSWGQINDVCVSGKRQSPVNIVSKATTKGSGDKHTKMQFAYRPTAGSIRNDGKSMYVDVSTNIRNEVVADGSHFQLTQYRFHSPSEHKIDGREYPVEMQMIHRNKAGKIVIVSVLFVTTDSAADHPFLVPLWKKMPGFGSMSGAVIDHVSPQAGMPRGQKFYSYSGSLTTPPCKEKVLWVVMKEAGVISFNQILKLRDALRLDYKESVRNGNARPVMPAGKRLIYKNSISKDDLKDVPKGCTQSADPGGKLAKEKLRKAKAITEKTQKLEKRSRGLEKREKRMGGNKPRLQRLAEKEKATKAKEKADAAGAEKAIKAASAQRKASQLAAQVKKEGQSKLAAAKTAAKVQHQKDVAATKAEKKKEAAAKKKAAASEKKVKKGSTKLKMLKVAMKTTRAAVLKLTKKIAKDAAMLENEKFLKKKVKKEAMKLAGAKAASKSLRKQLKKLSSKIAKMGAKLKKENAKLTKEKAKLKVAIAQAKSKQQKLSVRVKEKENEIKVRQQTISEMRKKLSKHMEKMAALKASTVAKKVHRADLNKMRIAHRKEITAIKIANKEQVARLAAAAKVKAEKAALAKIKEKDEKCKKRLKGVNEAKQKAREAIARMKRYKARKQDCKKKAAGKVADKVAKKTKKAKKEETDMKEKMFKCNSKL